MRVARVVLMVAGLAGLAWGAVLLAGFAVPAPGQALVAAGWLLGGPVVHDAVIAPVSGLAGLAVARLAPPRWRLPLTVGLVVGVVLALLAVPLLWRAYGTAPLPGLHDRDPVPRLVITFAVLAVAVVIGGFASRRRKS
jgi:hypothetical protein